MKLSKYSDLPTVRVPSIIVWQYEYLACTLASKSLWNMKCHLPMKVSYDGHSSKCKGYKAWINWSSDVTTTEGNYDVTTTQLHNTALLLEQDYSCNLIRSFSIELGEKVSKIVSLVVDMINCFLWSDFCKRDQTKWDERWGWKIFTEKNTFVMQWYRCNNYKVQSSVYFWE